MSNNPFKFKEFTISQDRTAMKVGTDGVLLGAWASIQHLPQSILDIGTGTGLIALQMAQRSDAEQIDAIEIDDEAFEQAVENFEAAIWNDRLFCYHCSLTEFTEEIDEPYDLIVSNPPFYNDDFQSQDLARNKARFTTSLTFENLIKSASKLLSKTGVFAVIIPAKEQGFFVKIAERHELFLNKVCYVRGAEESPVKRVLMEFSFDQKEIVEEELVIELERHVYSKEYIELVKDFYLKM